MTQDQSSITKNIQIFDTTLRDGQQSPGAGMSFEANIAYAQLAKKMRVDLLEVWFPSASALEFSRTQEVAASIMWDGCPIIVALSHVREHLVEKTIEALIPSWKHWKGRLHMVFPVDPAMIKAWLWDKDLSWVPAQVKTYTEWAIKAWLSVEFSLESYSRMWSNFDFWTDLIYAAVEWWASVINCPDSVGNAHHREGENYYVNLMNKHKQLVDATYPENSIIWSVHNHNDLWCAVENSLNWVKDGPARQIECTINWVWERAWNCSLEQIALQIHQHGKVHGIATNIALEHLQEASNFIAKHMLPRQPHRPIVWDNAARHSSWSHTNALLRNPLVYQAFDPVIVGKPWISLVFWPSSGGNHAMKIVEEWGYSFPKEHRAPFAQYVKDKHKERYKWVTDKEVVEAFQEYMSPVQITEFNYAKQQDHASLSLFWTFFEETDIKQEADSKDSALAILQQLCTKKMPWRSVDHYSSQADTTSVNANSIANIRIKHDEGRLSEWVWIDSDIEISALKALIDCYNKVYVEEKYKK